MNKVATYMLLNMTVLNSLLRRVEIDKKKDDIPLFVPLQQASQYSLLETKPLKCFVNSKYSVPTNSAIGREF